MKKAAMEEEPVFVGIPGPQSVRKELLTSVKSVINDLQRYEQLTEPKAEKAKFLLELRRVMQEIDVLNRKLKDSMPKTVKKIRPSQMAEEPSRPVRVAKPAPVQRVDLSKLEEEQGKLRALEDQLSKVEEKLNRL